MPAIRYRIGPLVCGEDGAAQAVAKMREVAAEDQSVERIDVGEASHVRDGQLRPPAEHARRYLKRAMAGGRPAPDRLLGFTVRVSGLHFDLGLCRYPDSPAWGWRGFLRTVDATDAEDPEHDRAVSAHLYALRLLTTLATDWSMPVWVHDHSRSDPAKLRWYELQTPDAVAEYQHDVRASMGRRLAYAAAVVDWANARGLEVKHPVRARSDYSRLLLRSRMDLLIEAAIRHYSAWWDSSQV